MQTYRRVLRPFDKNSGQACSAQAFDTAPPIHAFYQEIYNGTYTSTSLSTGSATGCFIIDFILFITFKYGFPQSASLNAIFNNPQLMA